MRSAGHRAGVKTLKNILRAAIDLNLEALTVYAFSTENWKRPHTEVDFLMHLFSEYLEREMLELHENKVRIHFLGRITELPSSLRAQIDQAEALMSANQGLRFNVAANYGGQDEILRAVRQLADSVLAGSLRVEDIDLAVFEAALDTRGELPVDLLIRTGGDLRVSNFLLWQSAYAEFWFTQSNFPDFTVDEFLHALQDFAKRERRFGAVVDKP